MDEQVHALHGLDPHEAAAADDRAAAGLLASLLSTSAARSNVGSDRSENIPFVAFREIASNVLVPSP